MCHRNARQKGINTKGEGERGTARGDQGIPVGQRWEDRARRKREERKKERMQARINRPLDRNIL